MGGRGEGGRGGLRAVRMAERWVGYMVERMAEVMKRAVKLAAVGLPVIASERYERREMKRRGIGLSVLRKDERRVSVEAGADGVDLGGSGGASGYMMSPRLTVVMYLNLTRRDLRTPS